MYIKYNIIDNINMYIPIIKASEIIIKIKINKNKINKCQIIHGEKESFLLILLSNGQI